MIENGGGYDAFIDSLLQDADDPHVVTAVEYSHDFPGNEGHEDDGHHHADESTTTEEPHDHEHAEGEDGHDHAGHDHIEGFNEHVWFDPHTMVHVVEAIADELTALDPDGADTYSANADDLVAEL